MNEISWSVAVNLSISLNISVKQVFARCLVIMSCSFESRINLKKNFKQIKNFLFLFLPVNDLRALSNILAFKRSNLTFSWISLIEYFELEILDVAFLSESISPIDTNPDSILDFSNSKYAWFNGLFIIKNNKKII